MRMNNPVICAKLILESKQIIGVPALSLYDIAKSEGIRFLLNDYPTDSWDGTLLFKGEKRAILINTHRGNTGRHNFTFAHELGHYFLDHQPDYYQDGETSIRCTAADISDGKQPREVDANKFAQELLMPEDSFRFDMIGSVVDFTLIRNMANKYMVSKQACSYRIVGLTQTPCIIILTEEMRITSIASSNAARTYVKNLKTVPSDTAAYVAISNRKWHEDFTVCDSSKWLCREVSGGAVYECTHIHKDSGAAMTIIKW